MAAEDDFPALGAAPAKKQAPQQAKPKKPKGQKMALDDFLGDSGMGGSCECFSKRAACISYTRIGPARTGMVKGKTERVLLECRNRCKCC